MYHTYLSRKYFLNFFLITRQILKFFIPIQNKLHIGNLKLRSYVVSKIWINQNVESNSIFLIHLQILLLKQTTQTITINKNKLKNSSHRTNHHPSTGLPGVKSLKTCVSLPFSPFFLVFSVFYVLYFVFRVYFTYIHSNR